MWRSVGALLLTFAAFAWVVVAIAVCFFYAASFWALQFGRTGALYAALISFGASFLGARLLLRCADALLQPYSGPFDARAYATSPRETFYRDWQRYTAELLRDRRYAFYLRTRQWDKIRQLEAEAAAAAAQAPRPDPPAPSRTSVADSLSPEEARRGARRFAASAVPRRFSAPTDDAESASSADLAGDRSLKVGAAE